MSSWDDDYARGSWDYLASVAEVPRYMVIANFLDRFCGSGPVLDVGCGEGLLKRYINPVRYELTGIDVSHVAIERAMHQHPSASWLTVDVTQFPSQCTAHFHAIVFNEVLYYVPDVARLLTAYAELLTGPSLVVVSTFSPARQQEEWTKRVSEVWSVVDSRSWARLDDSLLENPATGIRWRIAAFRPA